MQWNITLQNSPCIKILEIKCDIASYSPVCVCVMCLIWFCKVKNTVQYRLEKKLGMWTMLLHGLIERSCRVWVVYPTFVFLCIGVMQKQHEKEQVLNAEGLTRLLYNDTKYACYTKHSQKNVYNQTEFKFVHYFSALQCIQFIHFANKVIRSCSIIQSCHSNPGRHWYP